MPLLRFLLLIPFTFLFNKAFCQQDVEFHLNRQFLQGKNILKVKRDFKDPYLWVLAENNEVYRINSLTNVIDDYTNQFQPYRNFQFIDIAGRSLDTVFIATNSTNVLEYKKGVVKVIGAVDGLTGTVNSIGIDQQGLYNAYIQNNFTALIATDKGMCRYNYQNETMKPVPVVANSRIFEASYRNEMLSDGGLGRNYIDTVEKFAVTELVDYTIYVGELWLGGHEFGHNLKTAFFTKGSAYGNYLFSFYANQFWATENGLFQNSWNYSYTTDRPHRHYLNGINISKITSIYGLLGFGSLNWNGLVKENLLIGSTQGLYFSNSKYAHLDDAYTANYTFYHYNELGNKAINDICVNATTYTNSVCEDGVWVAAIDGLYLLKVDYGKYLTTQTLQAIQFKGQQGTVTETQLCANTSVAAVVNIFAYSGNVIQWHKDGKELPSEINSELLIKESGDYYAVLYHPCTAIHVESNHLKVTVISSPVFTFSYPSQINKCDGESQMLTISGSSSYGYRWYKDGMLNGNTSNSITLTQSGKYKAEISACSGTWVATSELQVNFIKLPVPVIKTDKTAYCNGDQATLSVNIPLDTTYTLYWLRDGVQISSSQNQTTLTTTQPGNYTVAINSNTASCQQVSATYPIIFNMPPTLGIKKIISTTLCDGQTVELKATYSAGNITWSTGETTEAIKVSRSGDYSARVRTSAGCEADQTINVQFLSNPVLNLPDATLCQFTSEKITLTAPSGFSHYIWNGQEGNQTFITSLLGNVTLEVSDQNGCWASQTINITSHCADIRMANTFTPNRDGINDTWAISGLEGDQNSMVKVYNRYGSIVFQSKGYANPWDGQYQGKKTPSGTYYYIITAKGNKQVLSGSVTIIY